MRSLSIVVALMACDKVPLESQSSSQEVQCVRDDDCVLLPSTLTCCSECPPVPPFEAAPAWVLDGMLIENETACADGRSCSASTCEAAPPGCIARAACVENRCAVHATDCGRPTS